MLCQRFAKKKKILKINLTYQERNSYQIDANLELHQSTSEKFCKIQI